MPGKITIKKIKGLQVGTLPETLRFAQTGLLALARRARLEKTGSCMQHTFRGWPWQPQKFFGKYPVNLSAAYG
jgi:hypothetical protein